MLDTPRVYLSPPHMSGEEFYRVKEAFDSNYIAPVGPMVDIFEKEFAEKIGTSYALAVSSGTAAIHLALRVLGVEEGDEVFVSTLTFIGGINPIIFQSAIPVFIDSDRDTWNMSIDLLDQELKKCEKKGKLPRVVMPTDIYGQCNDYDTINKICEHYGVPVIVDAAEALGAKYKGKYAGSETKAAIFSFNGNKIITTSRGGMLVSDDEEFIRHSQKLSQQAREPFPYYEHTEIGYNYRMSNILAAIGCAQLEVLDERVESGRCIFEYYKKAFAEVPGIEFMSEALYSRSSRWLSVISITPEIFGVDREYVRLALEDENIESRPVWKPMHMQPVFQNGNNIAGYDKTTSLKKIYKNRVIGGEVAEDLFMRGLCLPSGTAMKEEDLNRIITIILKSQK